MWPDPIWTDSSLVPPSSVSVLSERKIQSPMSQSIRDLKFGYSPLLMKPTPCPRHTTSGPRPRKTAVFITRDWRCPIVRIHHAKRQLRLVVRDVEPVIFPQLQNPLKLQPMDKIVFCYARCLSTCTNKRKQITLISCVVFIYPPAIRE